MIPIRRYADGSEGDSSKPLPKLASLPQRIFYKTKRGLRNVKDWVVRNPGKTTAMMWGAPFLPMLTHVAGDTIAYNTKRGVRAFNNWRANRNKAKLADDPEPGIELEDIKPEGQARGFKIDQTVDPTQVPQEPTAPTTFGGKVGKFFGDMVPPDVLGFGDPMGRRTFMDRWNSWQDGGYNPRYADGGEVPRYAGGGEVTPMPEYKIPNRRAGRGPGRPMPGKPGLLRRAVNWMGEHPGATILGATGLTGGIAGGIALYRYLRNRGVPEEQAQQAVQQQQTQTPQQPQQQTPGRAERPSEFLERTNREIAEMQNQQGMPRPAWEENPNLIDRNHRDYDDDVYREYSNELNRQEYLPFEVGGQNVHQRRMDGEIRIPAGMTFNGEEVPPGYRLDRRTTPRLGGHAFARPLRPGEQLPPVIPPTDPVPPLVESNWGEHISRNFDPNRSRQGRLNQGKTFSGTPIETLAPDPFGPNYLGPMEEDEKPTWQDIGTVSDHHRDIGQTFGPRNEADSHFSEHYMPVAKAVQTNDRQAWNQAKDDYYNAPASHRNDETDTAFNKMYNKVQKKRDIFLEDAVPKKMINKLRVATMPLNESGYSYPYTSRKGHTYAEQKYYVDKVNQDAKDLMDSEAMRRTAQTRELSSQPVPLTPLQRFSTPLNAATQNADAYMNTQTSDMQDFFNETGMAYGGKVPRYTSGGWKWPEHRVGVEDMPEYHRKKKEEKKENKSEDPSFLSRVGGWIEKHPYATAGITAGAAIGVPGTIAGGIALRNYLRRRRNQADLDDIHEELRREDTRLVAPVHHNNPDGTVTLTAPPYTRRDPDFYPGSDFSDTPSSDPYSSDRGDRDDSELPGEIAPPETKTNAPSKARSGVWEDSDGILMGDRDRPYEPYVTTHLDYEPSDWSSSSAYGGRVPRYSSGGGVPWSIAAKTGIGRIMEEHEYARAMNNPEDADMSLLTNKEGNEIADHPLFGDVVSNKYDQDEDEIKGKQAVRQESIDGSRREWADAVDKFSDGGFANLPNEEQAYHSDNIRNKWNNYNQTQIDNPHIDDIKPYHEWKKTQSPYDAISGALHNPHTFHALKNSEHYNDFVREPAHQNLFDHFFRMHNSQ